MHKIKSVLFAMLVSGSVFAATQATYYVSPIGNDNNSGTSPETPFQTLEKARQAVDAVNDNMTGDIQVYLRGGTYTLTNTLSFTTADSASNGFRITYQAYGNEVPVISGGTLVSGWTQHDGNIYKAPLNRNGKLRTLIVNGERRFMAKSSGGIGCNGGHGTYSITIGQADWAWISGSKADGLKYDENDIGELNNPSYVEITQATTWNENTVCVREIATVGDERVFYLQQPYGAISMNGDWGAFSASGSHTIHNAYELLDAPGEFYFDDTTDTLYYYKSSEDMSSAKVYAPLLGELMTIQGTDLSNRVENLTFKGITFAYAEAELPEVDGSFGKATVQAATWCMAFADGNWHNDKYQAYDVIPGAIMVNSADSIRFEENIVKHVGNEGICFVNDVQNSAIVGNVMTDVGGSAILVGHPQHVYERDGGMHEKYDPIVEAACYNTLVKNNLLYGMTEMYAGHAGITAYFVNTLEILNNHIESTQYSGVSLGWGWWDFNDANTGGNPTTVAGNNKFNNNRVYDCMNTLHDGGAFYTLGSQPNSEVSGNYVKAESEHFQGVLHPDEGTAWYTGSNMVFEITPGQDNFELNDWREKHDIHYSNIYSTSDAYADGAPNSSVTDLHVYPDADWPQEALDIIDEAGLEDTYDYLWDILESIIGSGSTAINGDRYEAEEAALSGDADEASNHDGYSGSGFVDGYYNSDDAAAVFFVGTDAAGSYILQIQYAAGHGDCSNLDLYINGSKTADLLLPASGAWSSWSFVQQEITLAAGQNTIELRADSATTDCANLDYIEIGQKSSPEVSAEIFQAEDAILNGGAVVASGNAGFDGEGYVEGYYNSDTPTIEFPVSCYLPGVYQIGIRYSAGHNDCTTMNLDVNGAQVADLLLPSTGSWTNWLVVTQQVALVKGLNAIELNADTASTDCANLDYISVESIDVKDALVAPYILTDGSSVSVGWNPGTGFDWIYRTAGLTNDFSLIQSNAFSGVYSEVLEKDDAAGFYRISTEMLP
ncbi:CBM35 domain-containing protein [Pontiellaceae bacterium B1224]|nr:CBM35 domain-containing protein [Pontiellaceae bacterium B1224]